MSLTRMRIPRIVRLPKHMLGSIVTRGKIFGAHPGSLAVIDRLRHSRGCRVPICPVRRRLKPGEKESRYVIRRRASGSRILQPGLMQMPAPVAECSAFQPTVVACPTARVKVPLSDKFTYLIKLLFEHVADYRRILRAM